MVLVPKSGTGTMMQWASGTGTTQTGTGTTASAALFVHIFALLSPVFIYRWLGTLRNDY